MEEIFEAATSFDERRTVWLGPCLYNTILQSQQDNIQGVSAFTRAVKVMWIGIVRTSIR
jgi:hypothetical protein